MLYKIPEDVINNILRYLSTRPFSEVFQLIENVRQNIIPITEEAKPIEDKTPDAE